MASVFPREMGLFRIKICGITNLQDGQVAAQAGADAIGLNFYPSSPRYVERERAERIAAAMPPGVAKVGVFVNSPASQVLDYCEQVGVDWIQLHGDEPPEMLAELGARPVVRAFRCGPAGVAPVLEYLERCVQSGHRPAAVLIDAYQAGAYGGTGRLVDWQQAAWLAEQLGACPLVLAGGLRPQNLAEAIGTVRPWAVDTASGVELQLGHKDAALVAAFVREARAAFQRLENGGAA